ncbi:hypothetical protein Tdes44962_MAKER07722 [Teratosphaeria destructans]|uniref:Uncharacterized protein n=1 Tax=Teratosphaeria destructans TaxID=418781 RepID=A0A9W7W5X1_9PEZI|nr:hypothetical protein Tdes44962_MAKER07722 [Teratosphaeria destructans]
MNNPPASTLLSLDHCARAVQPTQTFTITIPSSNQRLRCVHTLLVRHEKHTNGMQILSHKGYTEAPRPGGEQHQDSFTSPQHIARKKVYVIIYIGPKIPTLEAANRDVGVVRRALSRHGDAVKFIGGTDPVGSGAGGWTKLAAVYEGDPWAVWGGSRGGSVVPRWRVGADEQLERAGYARRGARMGVVGGRGEGVEMRWEILRAGARGRR